MSGEAVRGTLKDGCQRDVLEPACETDAAFGESLGVHFR